MLSANRFGVPEELTLHGFAPFFKDFINTGWDGQFYYYISNDILALRDTPNHIDSDAYRYQRIGFPLLVSVLGNVLFLEWISPTFYLLNYFLLTLIAVVIGSALLHRRQISPYLILLWALFTGTQLCLQNGLIDAAADSFLILALFCSSYSLLFTVLFFTMAALTKEIYVIFLFIFVVLCAVRHVFVNGVNIRDLIISNRYSFLGLCVWCTWQLFVTLRFGHAPSSQSYDNFSRVPLGGLATRLAAPQSGLTGYGIRWADGIVYFNYEKVLLVVYFIFLGIFLLNAIRSLVTANAEHVPWSSFGPLETLLIGSLLLGISYLFLGPSVLTGYENFSRTLSIFILCTVLCMGKYKHFSSVSTLISLFFCFICFNIMFFRDRLVA